MGKLENALRSLVLAIAMGMGSAASAGNLVYFHDRISGLPELYTFDPATGVSTFRAPMSIPARFFSLQREPATGVVYGVEPNASGIYTVDLNTGVATFVSNAVNDTITNIAFDPTTGAMYGLGRNSSNLYKIDPTSGASVLIGNTGAAVRTGLCCTSAGQLHAMELNGTLYAVDKSTAASTFIGGGTGGISLLQGATITASGLLYVTDYGGWLYRIDLANGTASFAGNSGHGIGLLGLIEESSSCAPPVAYCTAKLNSLGCLPAIGSTGSPSATTGGGFVVSCNNVRNFKNGLLFYGVTGRAALPFQGGTLCVASPIHRTGAQNSGGTPLPANDCSGTWSLDMNAFALSAGPPAPYPPLKLAGTLVDCQWWGRDPGFAAPNNTQLSNGLEYCVGP
jgi:hypothetical protein